MGVCSYLLISFWFTRIYANSKIRLKRVYLKKSIFNYYNYISKRSFSLSTKFLKSQGPANQAFTFNSSSRGGSSDINVISLIVGSLLSTSYLIKSESCISSEDSKSSRKLRIVFITFGNNVEYLKSIYLVLVKAGCCDLNCFKMHKLIGKGQTIFFLFTFKTHSSYNFIWLYDIFYKNNQKIIPKYNYLYELFTPLTLVTL